MSLKYIMQLFFGGYVIAAIFVRKIMDDRKFSRFHITPDVVQNIYSITLP